MLGGHATAVLGNVTLLEMKGVSVMNIADRIQNLRKIKGISQEELADKVGVSRQAVSKWESEQSIPDLDKVIIMSELFDVTTDYILKGIESPRQDDEKKADALIFVIVGTVLNFMGLAISAVVWYEEQVAGALMIGLIFLALGCMVFGVGLLGSAQRTRRRAKYSFWAINIWLLCFIPLSFVYNVLFSGTTAPYPLPVQPLVAFPVFWLVYIAICLSVTIVILRKRKSSGI